MPKRSKKGLKKCNSDIIPDVKLSDFANSSVRTGRLRKSIGNKDIAVCYDSDDVLWYERDLDEFELLNISENTKKLKSKASSETSQNATGIRYPIDVWFLIGQAIQPEDVKKFALICKDSYFVSRSYSFWLRMYKKHYTSGIELPGRLQPECIEQSFCLKTSVVRALYHMYPPFTKRISGRFGHSEVCCLSNLCCSLMWRIQEGGRWLFHFKLQTNDALRSAPLLTYGASIQALWGGREAEQDTLVNHNPEQGCRLLRFSCPHFVDVPQRVVGSRLAEVRVRLANDMRRHTLRLSFSHANYSHKSTSKSSGCGDMVEFDAVENLTVLNWWHPQYPANNKI